MRGMQGRQFDPDGNLVDWWDPETDRKFREKAQCIIAQYGNYTVPEVGLAVSLHSFFRSFRSVFVR